MASSCFESDGSKMQVHLPVQSDARPGETSPEEPALSPTSPRHGSGKRPKQLMDMSTPTRPRRRPFDLPCANLEPPRTPDNNVIERRMKEIMKQSGILHINGIKYQSTMSDLEELGELGYGTSGHVFKMLHKPSQEVIAVKQMRRSGNPEENKRIAMDLEVVLKSHDCPYIVQCLGCFITDSEVWICMELMSTCFDKLLKRLSDPIPEPIIGKVTLATVRALHYLKENHDVIHRDVKPSNILLDNRGNVKLCDFGISGHLVNSKAHTKNAGCTAYLAPERINPPDPRKPDYDIRADVWSLGITLVELATSRFPYPDCISDFEVLSKVLQEDPPTLPAEVDFTSEFRDFVKCCLAKDYRERPKYRLLLEHEFLKKFMVESVDVSSWYARCTPSSPSPIHRAPPPVPPHHQRSLSEAGASITSHPEFMSPTHHYRVHSPMMCRRNVVGADHCGEMANQNHPFDTGGLSPPTTHHYILQQRLHHQQNQHLTRRSTSVSPCRGVYPSSTIKEDGGCGVSNGRKKLSSFLKLRLGNCAGGGGSSGSTDGDRSSPEPPPRHNRSASPHVLRRLPPDSNPSALSPSLPRRYVSPSPPQPPPRRLSETGGSLPASPLHHRLATFTPQPLRRHWPPVRH